VGTEMRLELIPRDGADVCMGIAVRLSPVGCRSKEPICGKKNFLVIHAMGNHMLLLDSLKTIFSFHWVLSL
jgi:hypothetical protein